MLFLTVGARRSRSAQTASGRPFSWDAHIARLLYGSELLGPNCKVSVEGNPSLLVVTCGWGGVGDIGVIGDIGARSLVPTGRS